MNSPSPPSKAPFNLPSPPSNDQMNSPSPQPLPSQLQSSVTTSSCATCGFSKHRCIILHNLRHHGINNRYCTNCVLKNHHGQYCPICFYVYEETPPPRLRVICGRCPAIAHRSCASVVAGGENSADSPPSFLCPSCSEPTFSFFNPTYDGNHRSLKGSIDAPSAQALVCAAMIAAKGMIDAASAARYEAHRCAIEAANARKKAREALERFEKIASLEEKDRLQEEQQLVKRQRKK